MSKLFVYETRKRSLLKVISARVIEIIIDSIVLYFFGKLDVGLAIGLAVAIEFICLSLHFIVERIWNKINYGRIIMKKKGKKGGCK
jgi:uncharacterized membrane protein